MPEELNGQQQNSAPSQADLAASLAANLNANAGGGGGGVQTPPADPTQTPVATGTLQRGTDNVATPASDAAVAAAQAVTQQQGFRDQLRALGVDLSGLPDDRAALAQVAQIYQQLPQIRQLAMVGEQVYPYLSQFRGWLTEQQQRQQQAQQPAPWWKAPEYDPAWVTKLTRDPATGQIVPVQGAPPDIVAKFTAWSEHRQNFLDKFAQNPIDAIKPGIQQLVQEMIAPALQQATIQQNEARRAEALVSQNADWLHERTPTGDYARDQFGNKVLSVWGQRYAGYAQQAQQLGIAGTDNMHNYAMGLVERDFAVAQIRAQQAAQQGQQQGNQAKQDFVNGARHQPNYGSQHAAGTNGAPINPAPIVTQSQLKDLLTKRMAAAGIR